VSGRGIGIKALGQRGNILRSLVLVLSAGLVAIMLTVLWPEVLAASTAKKTPALLLPAKGLFDQKKYSESLRAIEKLQKVQTSDAAAVEFLRGVNLHKLQRFEEAFKAFRRALNSDSTMLAAWFNCACSAAKLKKHGSAFDCLAGLWRMLERDDAAQKKFRRLIADESDLVSLREVPELWQMIDDAFAGRIPKRIVAAPSSRAYALAGDTEADFKGVALAVVQTNRRSDGAVNYVVKTYQMTDYARGKLDTIQDLVVRSKASGKIARAMLVEMEEGQEVPDTSADKIDEGLLEASDLLGTSSGGGHTWTLGSGKNLPTAAGDYDIWVETRFYKSNTESVTIR